MSTAQARFLYSLFLYYLDFILAEACPPWLKLFHDMSKNETNWSSWKKIRDKSLLWSLRNWLRLKYTRYRVTVLKNISALVNKKNIRLLKNEITKHEKRSREAFVSRCLRHLSEREKRRTKSQYIYIKREEEEGRSGRRIKDSRNTPINRKFMGFHWCQAFCHMAPDLPKAKA